MCLNDCACPHKSCLNFLDFFYYCYCYFPPFFGILTIPSGLSIKQNLMNCRKKVTCMCVKETVYWSGFDFFSFSHWDCFIVLLVLFFNLPFGPAVHDFILWHAERFVNIFFVLLLFLMEIFLAKPCVLYSKFKDV